MAGESGGGIFHFGPLKTFHGCKFLAKAAGDRGSAVMSLGVMESMLNVIFETNVFFCDPGFFQDEIALKVQVMVLSCAGCSRGVRKSSHAIRSIRCESIL